MIQDIYKKRTNVSSYQPSKEVAELTYIVKKDWSAGNEILHKPWDELNGYSVIDRMNKDQRTFNSFVDETVEDPDEAWKFRGTRSLARNKTMAMHAHLTANFIVPTIFAQNEKQEEDRDMSEVMRDVLEWMSINSNYRSSFIVGTMGMLVNPVTYLGADYCEVFQKIKEKGEDGKLTTKEILDEVLSGFQVPVYSADQVLITNAFEQNIQKQRVIIQRRFVEYTDLEAKWGEHPNWQYVTPGIQSVYSEDDGLFYDVKDEAHELLVEEAKWKCRRDDSEVVFLNGIYMGEENIDNNPIKHRDNRNAPKYNLIPFGYERINEHFFFFKSLINRVGWDNDLLDSMYEITMNREILDVLTPVVVSGAEKFDSQVVFPNSVVAFENPDAKVTPLLPARNPMAGYNAMSKIEESIDKESINDTQSGQLPQASQKAFTVAKADNAAKIILKGAGRNLGISIIQYGDLMTDIALQHLTTAQIDEITGAEKYRPFILQDQMVNGKKVSKKILFDASLVGKEMTDEEKKYASLKLLSKVGYPNNKESVYLVNPHLFSKMKYMCRIEPDALLEKNTQFEQAMATNIYTLLRADPMIKPEPLIRKLLNSFYRGEADDMIAEGGGQEGVLQQVMNGQGAQPPQSPMGAQVNQKITAQGLNQVA